MTHGKIKASPVWEYFCHFDPAHHPDMKSFRICLICKEGGVDKKISIGKDYSPTPLITHLRSHQKQ
jgi:hypothetical protein